MVISASSLAVFNWHVTDPECNAQLSIVSARAIKHDRQPGSSASTPTAVEQVQARATARQQNSRDLIERFRKATLRRLQQQKAKATVVKSQVESVLSANLAQYRATTETQIGRRLDQHASQLRTMNKAPLYRERDRVLAQARAIRLHLLTFRTRPTAPDETAPVDPEPARARTPTRSAPFWARLPDHLQARGDAVQLSRAQQAQLAAAVRKWEMEQDRHRARIEAQLIRRAKASLSRPNSKSSSPSSSRISAHDDEGVQRLTLTSIPSESAVQRARTRSYGDAIRAKNHAILTRGVRSDRQLLRTRRRQLLQRVALAQVPVPALCACGLTIFSDRGRTAACTAKCLFRDDPDAFDSAVDNFLANLQQCL